jgi:hypothetical protein
MKAAPMRIEMVIMHINNSPLRVDFRMDFTVIPVQWGSMGNAVCRFKDNNKILFIVITGGSRKIVCDGRTDTNTQLTEISHNQKFYSG